MGTIASVLQWSCTNCNTINPTESLKCLNCGTVRKVCTDIKKCSSIDSKRPKTMEALDYKKPVNYNKVRLNLDKFTEISTNAENKHDDNLNRR